jgi:hypothetical protein
MNFVRLAALLGLALLASPDFAFAGPIKNQQTILDGVLTRAGVSGQTQLSDDQLVSLCESGYSQAFYLYSGATAREIACSKGTISYRSISWLNTTPILEAIDAGLRGGGKVFVHCNNGAHASGFVAAIALRQFCGYSAEQALNYWYKTNTYGNPPGLGTIKAKLRAFTPVSSLSTSPSCR